MNFQHGINFNDLPAWQRRGVGIYWQVYAKAGVDPQTGEAKHAQRRRLCIDMDLPMGDAYASFVRQQLASADVDSPV